MELWLMSLCSQSLMKLSRHKPLIKKLLVTFHPTTFFSSVHNDRCSLILLWVLPLMTSVFCLHSYVAPLTFKPISWINNKENDSPLSRFKHLTIYFPPMGENNEKACWNELEWQTARSDMKESLDQMAPREDRPRGAVALKPLTARSVVQIQKRPCGFCVVLTLSALHNGLWAGLWVSSFGLLLLPCSWFPSSKTWPFSFDHSHISHTGAEDFPQAPFKLCAQVQMRFYFFIGTQPHLIFDLWLSAVPRC